MARRRIALVAGEPSKEVLDITTVIGDRTRSNKAVNFHRPVVSLPKFPGAAVDGFHALRGTDGVNVAQSGEPVDEEKLMIALRLERQYESSTHQTISS